MLLAKGKPGSGFRKSVPLAAADAPKVRGFGPRKKAVALARKAAPLGLVRTGGPLADGAMPAFDEGAAASAPEDDFAVAWVKDIDWGGTPLSSPEVASRGNGHDHSADFAADLPPPSALPPMTPAMGALN